MQQFVTAMALTHSFQNAQCKQAVFAASAVSYCCYLLVVNRKHVTWRVAPCLSQCGGKLIEAGGLHEAGGLQVMSSQALANWMLQLFQICLTFLLSLCCPMHLTYGAL
jgi:hypothetical protein